MGYLYLVISLFAGTTKGYCGKRVSGYTNGYMDAIFANLIRMVLCVVISIVLLFSSGAVFDIVPDYRVLAISALSGISTAVFVICWLLSVKKGAYMMLDVFLMLGVVVPLFLSNIIFGEKVKFTQWIGYGVLVIAALIMCSYNNSVKSKMSMYSIILLLVCGLSNGVTDFSQKLFIKYAGGSGIAVFNLYTYIFAAVVLGVIALAESFAARKKPGSESSGFKFNKIFGYILVMSLCLFFNSYFKTKAADTLDAAQLYPLNQGCSLVLSTVMAAALFKERITAKGVVGILLSFAGLIIINVI